MADKRRHGVRSALEGVGLDLEAEWLRCHEDDADQAVQRLFVHCGAAFEETASAASRSSVVASNRRIRASFGLQSCRFEEALQLVAS
jgi:hypothetical protein